MIVMILFFLLNLDTYPSQTPQSSRSPRSACPGRGQAPAAPADTPGSLGRTQSWRGWPELALWPLIKEKIGQKMKSIPLIILCCSNLHHQKALFVDIAW